MEMDRKTYLSYLLRIWSTIRGEQRVWQASLEETDTGERMGFTDLQALLVFLEDETGQRPEHSRPDLPISSSSNRLTGRKGVDKDDDSLR